MIDCTKIEVKRHRRDGAATLRVFETDDAQAPVFEARIVGSAGSYLELLVRYAGELDDRRVHG